MEEELKQWEEQVSNKTVELCSNPKELENVLYATTQPNNEDLKKATIIMQNLLSQPETIMTFADQIEKSQISEVRQAAAIYLRKQIQMHWKIIPNDVKEKLKKFLLDKIIASNIIGPERLAIAAALTKVAQLTYIRNDEWKELLFVLQQMCCQNLHSDVQSNIQLREISVRIFRNLITFCGGSLKKHFPVILQMLQGTINDERSLNVQVESVKVIGAMVNFLENKNEVDIIETCIPAMVNVIERCLKKADEANVLEGMNVFNDLADSKVPVLNKHAKQLVEFFMKIASAKNQLPISIRKQAVNFFIWMCKSKPKTVIKLNLVPKFLELCINLIIESEDDEEIDRFIRSKDISTSKIHTDNDENDDDDDNNNNEEDTKKKDKDNTSDSPLITACDLLDEIFLCVPSEQCFPLAIKAIEFLIQDKEANKRKAAYVTIAMMAEGCDEIIQRGNNLLLLIKGCLQGAHDENLNVRKWALIGLTQLETHINSKILLYHSLIFPEIFKIFQHSNKDNRVKEHVLDVIEMMLDAFENNNDIDDDDDTEESDNDEDNTNNNDNDGQKKKP